MYIQMKESKNKENVLHVVSGVRKTFVKGGVLHLDPGRDAAPGLEKSLSGGGGGGGGMGDSDTFFFFFLMEKVDSIFQTQGRGILVHDRPL